MGQDFEQLHSYLIEKVSKPILQGKDEFETTAQFNERIQRLTAAPILDGPLTLQSIFAFRMDPFATNYDADKETLTAAVYYGFSGIVQVGSGPGLSEQDLYFTNFEKFPRLAQEIHMPVAEARERKSRLKLLAICQLVSPFTGGGAEVHLIRTKLLELWFYDPPSGKVYAKLRPQDFPSGSPFRVETLAAPAPSTTVLAPAGTSETQSDNETGPSYVGPRGGIYHYSKSGKKVYEKKPH